MEQEILARLHGVLIIAKAGQAIGDEVIQRLQGIGSGHRPAKRLKVAEVVAKVRRDQRHHR